MSLKFENLGSPSVRTLVIRVIDEIEKNKLLLLYISRIFNNHRSNDKTKLTTIDSVIQKTFKNPKLKLEQSKITELTDLLKDIYRDKNFSDIRSEVLELIIYKFGPFSNKISRVNTYIEPTIKHNSVTIGNNQRLIDSVFHVNDHDVIEFIECKSNIASVIPKTLPLVRMSIDNREKVEYLVNAHSYLNTHFVEPEIFVACYNTEYEDQLNNVHNNWGYNFIKFLGPEEIYNKIKHIVAV